MHEFLTTNVACEGLNLNENTAASSKEQNLSTWTNTAELWIPTGVEKEKKEHLKELEGQSSVHNKSMSMLAFMSPCIL